MSRKTKILSDLNILSNLSDGHTLSAQTMTIINHKSWSSTLWRTYSGENRKQTISHIKCIFKEALSFLKLSNNLKEDLDIINSLEHAIKGILTLKQTYSDDFYIISDIDQFVNEFREELQPFVNSLQMEEFREKIASHKTVIDKKTINEFIEKYGYVEDEIEYSDEDIIVDDTMINEFIERCRYLEEDEINNENEINNEDDNQKNYRSFELHTDDYGKEDNGGCTSDIKEMVKISNRADCENTDKNTGETCITKINNNVCSGSSADLTNYCDQFTIHEVTEGQKHHTDEYKDKTYISFDQRDCLKTISDTLHDETICVESGDNDHDSIIINISELDDSNNFIKKSLNYKYVYNKLPDIKTGTVLSFPWNGESTENDEQDTSSNHEIISKETTRIRNTCRKQTNIRHNSLESSNSSRASRTDNDISESKYRTVVFRPNTTDITPLIPIPSTSPRNTTSTSIDDTEAASTFVVITKAFKQWIDGIDEQDGDKRCFETGYDERVKCVDIIDYKN